MWWWGPRPFQWNSCKNFNWTVAMWVYLPASARFQTFTWLRQIPCNHHFLDGLIQTRDVMSWWGPQPFQLSNCKNFKKRVWKLVSKGQMELAKEGVIGYIVPRTSSEWHVIESAWQNTDIARKAYSRTVMNCQSYCYGILHFVLGSHLILQRKIPCFYLFVVLKSTDV